MSASRVRALYPDHQRYVSEFDVGAVHISPVAILWALVWLIIGSVAVRAW